MKASMCLWGKMNLLPVRQRPALAYLPGTGAGLLLRAYANRP